MTALATQLRPPALVPSGSPDAKCPVPSASAAASTAVIADPNIPGLWWIAIDVAAPAVGITNAAMRLRCEKLIAQGLAKKLSPVVGGQTKWHISSAHDPRLQALARSAGGTSNASGSRAGSDDEPTAIDRLNAAPGYRRKKAQIKAEAVRLFREWRNSPGVTVSRDYGRFAIALKAKLGLEVPLRTMWRWNDLAGQAGDVSTNFAGAAWELLDRRGGNRAQGFDDAAWDYFQALYLRDNRFSIAACHKDTAAKARAEGWTWIKLSRCQQLVKERIAPSLRKLARDGEEAWARDHMPPMVQDPDAWQTGQAWETDHMQFDLYCRRFQTSGWESDRPWLTTFIDRRSRKVMGWHVGWNHNSDSIRAALHHALSREGNHPPEFVIMDNGWDFASHEFSGATKSQRRGSRKAGSSRGRVKDESEQPWIGLFGLLGIRTQFCTPYNHNGKAIIERYHGVVHNDFDRRQDSWCGSKAEPRDQAKIKALLADKTALPDLASITAEFARWVEHYNLNADRNIDALAEHGVRRSPAEWYQRHAIQRRTIPNLGRVLEMIERRWERPLSPTKFGVSIVVSGKRISYGQHEPELQKLVGSGKKVFVTYNPDDTGSVRVYDDRFALICDAPMNSRFGGDVSSTPIRRRDLQAGIARQRAFKRAQRAEVDVAAGSAQCLVPDASFIPPSTDARMTNHATPTQRTFEHLRNEQLGPRAARPGAVPRGLAQADARDLADRTAESTDPARAAALYALKCLFRAYLASVGVGATFQTVYFTRWLDQTAQRPADLDLRCMGGIIGPLLRRGDLVAVGYQPDGGNPHTGHQSASRPVFRIARIPEEPTR